MAVAKRKTFVRRKPAAAPKKPARKSAMKKTEPALEPPVEQKQADTPATDQAAVTQPETPVSTPSTEQPAATEQLVSQPAEATSTLSTNPEPATQAVAAEAPTVEPSPAAPSQPETAPTTPDTAPTLEPAVAAPTTPAVQPAADGSGTTPPATTPNDHYGFHDGGDGEGGSKKKLILVLVLGVLFALLIGGGAYYYFAFMTQPKKETLTNQKPTVAAEPSPTPEEEVDLTSLTAQVLNGSGIAGEAAKVATLLEDGGFEDVDTGNADKDDFTSTIIRMKKDVPQSVGKKITDLLSKEYSVDTKTEELEEDEAYDIIVTVGADKAENTESDKTPTPSVTESP